MKTEPLATRVPVELAGEVRSRAAAKGVSPAAYIRLVLAMDSELWADEFERADLATVRRLLTEALGALTPPPPPEPSAACPDTTQHRREGAGRPAPRPA